MEKENLEFDLDKEFAEYEKELKNLHNRIDIVGKQLDDFKKSLEIVAKEIYG